MREEYLANLVKFYPVSNNQKSVLALLEYVQQFFEMHGLQTKIFTFNDIHSLYAQPSLKKHSRLLLQAHVDVVPTRLPYQKKLQEKDGKLYGRGVFDMLFATACYMEFVATHSNQLSELDIAFFLSGDEELGGENGVGRILDEGYTTEVCVLPDAGLSFGSLNVAAKGVYTISVKIEGASHHGARPWEGDGAAGKLVRFLTDFDQAFSKINKQESTLTVAKLRAGDADNRGPSTAIATLDIRYKNKDDFYRITTSLNSLLNLYNGHIIDSAEGSNYSLDLSNDYIKRFITLYGNYINHDVNFETAHGSSDARYFSDKNIPVVMFRPDGGKAHGDEEWLSQESFQQFYNLLEQYALEIGKMDTKHD